MQLDQHKILITGGSTGIGLALAKALIARGNQVAICGRRLDKLEAARASLPGLHIIQCDLTDPAAAEPLITRAAEARALPHLRAVTTGAIINVSSALVFSPKADAAIYCATKAAVHSFTQALRYQMADDIPHIKVFEIMPPLTDTDMTEGHGTGKITPDQVAVQTLRGIASDVMEIRVGKAKLLGFIQRLSPSLAAKIIRNS
jgi:short-subunit dehydrogenase involved in D-alanine esterification of teichoic acids